MACQVDRVPSTTRAKSLHRNHVLTLVWAETCHQATGMIDEKTRPRLLHVRYKRIQMYGSISTGKLPSHQRDPMEGDCLTKPLLRGHVKVGELRIQRPRANRRWNDKGRSLSRLARARRNASGRAVTLTLTRIRTKREREGTREDHIDNGDGRETRHWAS